MCPESAMSCGTQGHSKHFALREITVRRVDQFINQLSVTKSHSKARLARMA